jgi:hypothetical protein
MRKQSCWRLNPDPALQDAVEEMARAEGRPISQMLFHLVRESVRARRQADGTVEKLAAIIKTVAASAAS